MSRRSHTPALGISSLLVIFALLCLTALALLSVSTVRAQARLAQKSHQSAAAYYEADTRANEILAQLRAGEIPPEVTFSHGVYRFTCPISETLSLQVEVTLSGEEYQILRWQAVSTAAWIPQEQIPVWQGTERSHAHVPAH